MNDKNKTRGIFDDELRLRKLSKQGDPLEQLSGMMDFEMFRPILEKTIKTERKGPGGRPPYDVVMKFKVLILQRFFNISDEQLK